MQFTVTLSVLLSSIFATLVSGEACVVGGPKARVDSAEWCCYAAKGKWFSNYDFQGICVFDKAGQNKFDGCFQYKVEDYIPTCIACDEKVDCGLTR